MNVVSEIKEKRMNIDLGDKADVFNYMSLTLLDKMREMRKCQKQLIKCWHHRLSSKSTDSQENLHDCIDQIPKPILQLKISIHVT